MEAIKANISTDEYLQVQNLLDSYKSGLLEKVLVALYNEEHKQSELAKLVDSTPASLANLMHKFDDTDEKIIIKKRRGRAQYYSLSKAAQQYVQQNLLLFSMDTKRISITKNVSIEENMQAFQSLFREFCEISGNDWDEYLFTLLDKRPNRFDVSIQKAYQKLYDEAKRLFINNGEKILLPIEKIIDDRLISKKLYRALIPLSGAKILAKIERTNGPCFTNRLIESAFDTIQSQTGIDDELKNEARVSLSSDEYEQILHFLTLIIELLGEQSHNSAEIENLLMHQYMLSENIAVFIRLRYSKYIYDLTNSYKPAPCCNIK